MLVAGYVYLYYTIYYISISISYSQKAETTSMFYAFPVFPHWLLWELNCLLQDTYLDIPIVTKIVCYTLQTGNNNAIGGTNAAMLVSRDNVMARPTIQEVDGETKWVKYRVVSYLLWHFYRVFILFAISMLFDAIRTVRV